MTWHPTRKAVLARAKEIFAREKEPDLVWEAKFRDRGMQTILALSDSEREAYIARARAELLGKGNG